MPEDYVALLRALFDAFNRGELASTASSVDEYVVWDARELAMPDSQGVYQGLAEVAAFWRSWLAGWERVTAEIVWIEGTGDRVVAWVKQTQAGRESGVVVDSHYGWDVTFRDGKMIRVSFFNDEAQVPGRDGDLRMR